MDVFKILAQLRKEREAIDEAIGNLERPASGSPRRGRTPGWLREFMRRRGGSTGQGGSGGPGGSGTPLPSYPRPRIEECPTRKRNTPLNPDLKTLSDAA